MHDFYLEPSLVIDERDLAGLTGLDLQSHRKPESMAEIVARGTS